MDFALDQRTTELRTQLLDFMDSHVYPAEAVFEEQAASADPWTSPAILEELKAEARKRGLWNLFLPEGPGGQGLTNLQYAPLAEITGRSPMLTPEALNCSAPDTGNMELLARFGTPEQQKTWLEPLLEGEIRSAFCMTERGVASSDATNVTTRIARDGDHYLINGRKPWSTRAMSPRCRLLIVMGKTDPTADRHRQQSMVLVPRDAEGVSVIRGMQMFGYDEGPQDGHAEIEFRDVRVPVTSLVGEEGHGFAIAQARLGPGRIHGCMRLIGMAERALELLCRRVTARVAFGRPIAEQGVVRDWIAESRVRIEQLRLLVLKAAWLMDTVGNRGAHTEIQAIKVSAPRTAEWIIDKRRSRRTEPPASARTFRSRCCGHRRGCCGSPTDRTRSTRCRWRAGSSGRISQQRSDQLVLIPKAPRRQEGALLGHSTGARRRRTARPGALAAGRDHRVRTLGDAAAAFDLFRRGEILGRAVLVRRIRRLRVTHSS